MPKLLPKVRNLTKIIGIILFRTLILDFGNGFDFGNDLRFWQWFGILFGILAMIWDFGNSLGFWQ
uniref:Uncharacterized protein n=1 Tax=Rhizophagus irregularis (strain DAOM 181602 / DAOM 197198 / MUCL 43194) TaxID=747089 RepID=U9SUS5_RHIID